MNHFELFNTWCAGYSSTPKQHLFSLGSWKKYILGIHPKKIIILAPFHSKAFVLLDKFETSWALIGRLSRDFFAISGTSNFKHFNQLLRLSILFESLILYLAFCKTILATLFRAFGLPLSFLPSKLSFLHDHSTTQHSDFSSFYQFLQQISQ